MHRNGEIARKMQHLICKSCIQLKGGCWLVWGPKGYRHTLWWIIFLFLDRNSQHWHGGFKDWNTRIYVRNSWHLLARFKYRDPNLPISPGPNCPSEETRYSFDLRHIDRNLKILKSPKKIFRRFVLHDEASTTHRHCFFQQKSGQFSKPKGSMYGIFTCIWLVYMVNVGKYTIHGWYGKHFPRIPIVAFPTENSRHKEPRHEMTGPTTPSPGNKLSSWC